MLYTFRSDLSAKAEGSAEIVLYIGDTGSFVHIGSTLKVVIEAAVVEVYRAYYSLFSVADEDLRVDETGGIFIYLHT